MKNHFYLGNNNSDDVEKYLDKAISLALNFKKRDKVTHYHDASYFINKYFENIPEKSCSIDDLFLIVEDLLNESVNFSSPNFMGFPDSGNSVAGLIGGVIESTCQQNLLNSDFCARAATFIEIVTVRWLRELIGYENPMNPESVKNLGGIATTGGTCSNMYGLLMARNKAYPKSFAEGIPKEAKPRILIPADITHYSIQGSVGLLGLGTDCIIKVPTNDFSLDIEALEKTIKECHNNGEEVICVVANAGDSRTLTIDNLEKVVSRVKSLAPSCWIHVDACHGGQLLFSQKYGNRLKGIEQADSISLDPHKVFNLPYTLSYFIFKDPHNINGFWTSSTLIMRDHWSLGQLTPNIGSKSWASLKLYLLLKHMGKENLSDVIDKRIELAVQFRNLLKETNKFTFLTDRSDINSVTFIYTGPNQSLLNDGKLLFQINEKIYEEILKAGNFYLHGFPIKDNGDCLEEGTNSTLFALRYMCGNPLVEEAQIHELITELIDIGDRICESIILSPKDVAA